MSPLPSALPTAFSLANSYPEFAGCHSTEKVIARAGILANKAFELDMAAAVKQVLTSPREIDLEKIAVDTATASAIGLTALFASKSSDMRDISLSPELFVARFPYCSTNSRLNELAEKGVNTFGDEKFKPNNGIGATSYDESIADDRVICYLLAKGYAAGRYLILPTDVFAKLAAAENLPFHVSPAFVVNKRDADTGRLVINYSDSGPNFDAKPITLSEQHGPIKPPQFADICRLLINAKAIFPGQEIFGLRRDIDAAYNRLLYSLRSALTCAFAVKINSVPHTVAPVVAMMGDQQVNFDFDQVTRAIAEVVAVRAKELSLSPLPLTTVATDDIIAVGSRRFIEAISIFIAETVGTTDSPGLLGIDAIALGKDLFGSSIEILGWNFNCEDETIAPNALTLAKLYYLFYTAVGTRPQAGQRIPLALLQRIASHAIRTANVVTAMLPFSRSFSAATCKASRRGFAFLTKTCVHDITQWRALLTEVVVDTRILTCPVSTPPIRQKLNKAESVLEHQIRAASHASVFAYSDAATGVTGAAPMLGGVVHGQSFFHLTLPISTLFATSALDDTGLSDINLHEATALILTAIMGVASLNRSFPPASFTLSQRHLHIYCDNSTAVSLTRTYRAQSPLLSFLLSTLTNLQVLHRCLITVGHIPGLLNIWADASSRAFAVPDGPALLAHLSRTCRLWTPLSSSVALIERAYNCSVATDWNSSVKSFINLELANLSSAF